MGRWTRGEMCGLAESGRLSHLGGTRTRTLLCGFRYRLGSIQMRRPSPVEGKTNDQRTENRSPARQEADPPTRQEGHQPEDGTQTLAWSPESWGLNSSGLNAKYQLLRKLAGFWARFFLKQLLRPRRTRQVVMDI